ncbi:hypothetical protein [uncultured Christiangramia sp.]|uniref:hypothetical protein n=1 Tax=uncultured Christiangramia sp. TaxID=503836 RepID=UPI0025CB87AB|nr:hypothetical protein [uncultured Christiangramia sp.]
MHRITRKLNFFRRNHFILFGAFWILMSIFYLFSQILSAEDSTFNYFMSFGYLIIGLLYFYQNHRYGQKKGEYIEWNDTVLNYQENFGKFYSFKLSSLINVTVTRENFIIKAQNAQGTMASLKGYSEEDIAKLRARFGNQTSSL